jgi:hypothetical protein
MKFAIEAWATEYGSPMELDGREASETKVDSTVERPLEKWEPLEPRAVKPPERVMFTDGVRRIDARIWIESPEGTRPGVCASYAAGAVLCDGRANFAGARVERGMFTAVTDAASVVCRRAHYGVRRANGDAAEQLWLAIQERMGELEAAVVDDYEADLTIVDGPLRGTLGGISRVGYIKTHHVSYLPPEMEKVVAALGPGQRTPVFLTLGRWGRFSWYVRLPGATGHAWAGVVRCETTADSPIDRVCELADLIAQELPRYASVTHKDPRAPQNLYPIAGLERELRRRLGDPQLLYRDLRVAAAGLGA